MGGSHGKIKEIGRIGSEELSVEWEISEFPVMLLHGSEDLYGSPLFEFGSLRWGLAVIVHQNREARYPLSGWVELNLVRFGRGPPESFRFSVGIRGSRGVENSREGEMEFSHSGEYYAWDNFCSASELMDHRTRLMPNDSLTITCVMKRPGAARDIKKKKEQ